MSRIIFQLTPRGWNEGMIEGEGMEIANFGDFVIYIDWFWISS